MSLCNFIVVQKCFCTKVPVCNFVPSCKFDSYPAKDQAEKFFLTI